MAGGVQGLVHEVARDVQTICTRLAPLLSAAAGPTWMRMTFVVDPVPSWLIRSTVLPGW
ncbi:MAG: hypothetical protein ACR2G2_12905 [Pseudonocardia sp.]